VWESRSSAHITFDTPNLLNDIAFIVENDLILSSISLRLEELKSRVEYMDDASLELCQTNPSSDLISVSLRNGTTYETPLLIGADGAKSKVRELLGSKYLEWQYNQMAIVGTLELGEEIDNNVAWQRFLPNGVIALLPLTKGLSSLVWSTESSIAKSLMSMDGEAFVDSLNKALWDDSGESTLARNVLKTAGDILTNVVPSHVGYMNQLPPSIQKIQEGSRAAFPLSFGHSVNYVDQRVALIGDAAHKVHPLAGQGVNLGFGDVECLVDEVSKSLSNGEQLGSIGPLLRYETERQRHNLSISLAIDGLQRLYVNNFEPIVALRSLGLMLVNSSAELKKAIMQRAAV